MIKLFTQPYCEACPDFEPNIEKIKTAGVGTNTYIRCQNEGRCATIFLHIRGQMMSEGVKNGFNVNLFHNPLFHGME